MLRKKILALMAEREISQVELAKRAGMNKIHLNQILTGRKIKITVETLQKIAKALSLPISELQGDLPEPEKPEPLNDRTQRARDFFQAKDIPEHLKKTFADMIEYYREKAKKEHEEGERGD